MKQSTDFLEAVRDYEIDKYDTETDLKTIIERYKRNLLQKINIGEKLCREIIL